MTDVTNPDYYKVQVTLECYYFTKHMPFNMGNAFKYIWRAGLKGDELTDLKKARWYSDRDDYHKDCQIPEDLTDLLYEIPQTWKYDILKAICEGCMAEACMRIDERIKDLENKPAWLLCTHTNQPMTHSGTM